MSGDIEPSYDADEVRNGLMTDDIVACTGAFSRDWVERLRDEVDAAFEEALAREGGAVGRWPHRYYVEIQPEGDPRLRRPRRPPMGANGVRDVAGTGLQHRGGRLRRAAPRRRPAALASRLPEPAGDA